MIDHVNYQVPTEVVHSSMMTAFMALLGLEEVPPTEALDKEYTVRWWEDTATGMRVHIVGLGLAPLRTGLGHLCVKLDDERWGRCANCRWVERYNRASPMRRLWLRGPGGLRVEVQHDA
jgi:hypothetical protein